MDPDFGMSYLLMGLIYNEREMYSEAVPEFQKAIELTGGLSWALAWLGYAYAMLGRKDETEKILHKIEERSKEKYMPATSMIPIFYALGDYDNVFACLERAIEEHDSIMSSIRIEPGFDGLRSDPRFQTILKKMGLD
jgi:adenylate cyclase